MPRVGLTRLRVIETAADIADESGWERLSLAAVADRAGVRLPSLYKHIESVESLRQDVAAQATRDLADALTASAVGIAGRQALRALGTAYRAFATTHPGRYAATIRPPRTQEGPHFEAAEAILRVTLAILDGYGIRGDDAVDAARALRSALHGFASLEATGGFGLPQDVERSFQALLDALNTMMRSWGRA